MNGRGNGRFYSLYRGLGIDVEGGRLGRGKRWGKVEMELGG